MPKAPRSPRGGPPPAPGPAAPGAGAAEPPPPSRPQKLRPLQLKVDPDRFPGLPQHPELERALLIRQALEKGMTRDEAITVAEMTMGPRAPRMEHLRPAGRPDTAKRPASRKARAKQASPVPAAAAKAVRRRA